MAEVSMLESTTKTKLNEKDKEAEHKQNMKKMK